MHCSIPHVEHRITPTGINSTSNIKPQHAHDSSHFSMQSSTHHTQERNDSSPKTCGPFPCCLFVFSNKQKMTCQQNRDSFTVDQRVVFNSAFALYLQYRRKKKDETQRARLVRKRSGHGHGIIVPSYEASYLPDGATILLDSKKQQSERGTTT